VTSSAAQVKRLRDVAGGEGQRNVAGIDEIGPLRPDHDAALEGVRQHEDREERIPKQSVERRQRPENAALTRIAHPQRILGDHVDDEDEAGDHGRLEAEVAPQHQRGPGLEDRRDDG
jgi:hypothetical protein